MWTLDKIVLNVSSCFKKHNELIGTKTPGSEIYYGAIVAYFTVLELDFNDFYALNSRGYLYELKRM